MGRIRCAAERVPANSTSWCVVNITMPPPREMRFDQRPGDAPRPRRRAPKTARPAPTAGGRAQSFKRASAARRFWPCDSSLHGRRTQPRARMRAAPRRGRAGVAGRPAMLRRIAEVLRGVQLVLDRVQVADVGEARRDIPRPARGCRGRSRRSRPHRARAARRRCAAGSSCRCRSRRAPAAARPAARSKERLEKRRRPPRVHSSPVARSRAVPSRAGGCRSCRRQAQQRSSDRRLQITPSSTCTSTIVPGVTLPWSVGRMMKQFASDIERRMPEPCSPVTRTLQVPCASALQDAALEFRAPGRFLEAGDARHLEGRNGRNRIAAGEREQRIAHELVEGDHHRDRVARQAEEMGAADLAVGERPPGLHRDLPEHHLAQLVEQILDEIRFADGNAAARDHDVGRGGRVAEGALEELRVVAHHAHVEHFAIQARQHAVDRVAVAVEDLACRGLAADRDELVARGEERDAQLAIDGDLADAQRRDEPDVGRAQREAALQRDLPDGEILAGLAQVLALACGRSPMVTWSPCALTCSCMTIVSAPGGTTPPVMMRTPARRRACP